jgi:hypothetical protein
VTNASSKSVGEMMSIPFQQIARYVKYYDDEISEQDKEIIDSVLQYEKLKERYTSVISDPVKNTYRRTGITLDFFKVWFKFLLKHPKTYIESFICNTYSYYYPNGESTSKPMVYDYIEETVTVNTGYFDIHYFSDNSSIRKMFDSFLKLLNAFPGIGIIFHQGFYTWIVMVYLLYVVQRRINCGVLSAIPVILHFLVCIASPVNGYFRYFMPIVFLVPFVMAWVSSGNDIGNKLLNEGE